MTYAIGIDLGGSSVKAVAVLPAGETLLQQTAEFVDDQRMDWAAKIRDLVRTLRTQVAAKNPELRDTPAVGLSAPGLAASDARSIAFMPGRLHGLEKLDWTKHLGWP